MKTTITVTIDHKDPLPETLTDILADRAYQYIHAKGGTADVVAGVDSLPESIGSEWVPCMKKPVVVHVREQRPDEQHISTREGLTPVKPDDLIMRGVQGEEYPIGREIFERTYKLHSDAPM